MKLKMIDLITNAMRKMRSVEETTATFFDLSEDLSKFREASKILDDKISCDLQKATAEYAGALGRGVDKPTILLDSNSQAVLKNKQQFIGFIIDSIPDVSSLLSYGMLEKLHDTLIRPLGDKVPSSADAYHLLITIKMLETLWKSTSGSYYMDLQNKNGIDEITGSGIPGPSIIASLFISKNTKMECSYKLMRLFGIYNGVMSNGELYGEARFLAMFEVCQAWINVYEVEANPELKGRLSEFLTEIKESLDLAKKYIEVSDIAEAAKETLGCASLKTHGAKGIRCPAKAPDQFFKPEGKVTPTLGLLGPSTESSELKGQDGDEHVSPTDTPHGNPESPSLSPNKS